MNDEIKVEKDSGRDMTPRLIGETYMKYPNEKSSRKYRYGLYKCQYCNKEFESMVNNIKGGIESCGCRKRKTNTSGYTGITFQKSCAKWLAQIHHNNKNVYLGLFAAIEEAVKVRDNYIIENNLPHKLSMNYVKETK